MTWEERLLISAEIAKTTNQLYKPLMDVTLTTHPDRFSVSGVCPYCGEHIEIDNIPMFPSVIPPLCRCGNFVAVCAADYVDPVVCNDNVNALCENSYIAVWPVTLTIFDLLKMMPAFQNDNVIIVDSAKDKQGEHVCKKVVVSSDIISQLNIRYVVIPTITKSTIASISECITRDFPCVERVVTLFDICYNKLL